MLCKENSIRCEDKTITNLLRFSIIFKTFKSKNTVLDLRLSLQNSNFFLALGSVRLIFSP